MNLILFSIFLVVILSLLFKSILAKKKRYKRRKRSELKFKDWIQLSKKEREELNWENMIDSAKKKKALLKSIREEYLQIKKK